MRDKATNLPRGSLNKVQIELLNRNGQIISIFQAKEIMKPLINLI